LDATNGTIFKPSFFFPLPCGHTDKQAMQLKWYSEGQLPPPFPFQKTFQSCVLLNCCIGRKHTMQLSALCWCVARGEKKKNTHKRGGENGCLQGVKLWGPFPYKQTTLRAIVYCSSFCFGKSDGLTSEGALQHPRLCW